MMWGALAAVAAFYVKGLCGFANTLVFTTILSFFTVNASISPVELLLGYPSNIILAWKERRAVRWKLCLPLAFFVVVGSIPGILFLKNANAELIKGVFGIVIILLGLEMLLGEFHPVYVRKSRAALLLIGVLSGILCGLYGVGALLGAYLKHVTDDSNSFKANICIVFLFENTLRIVLYAVWDILNSDLLKQAMILFPFMLIGLFSGMKSSNILDEKVMKKIVIGMLIVSGMALVWNNM